MTSLIIFTRRQMLTIALTAFLFHAGTALAQAAGPAIDAADRAAVPQALQSAAAASEADGLDTRIFRSVNNAQNQFKTSLFHVTDNSVAVLVVGIPVGCIVYGLAADNRNAVNTGVLLSASEVLTYGLKYVLKVSIKRPRPYEDLADVHVNDIESADQYSFPSGHTAGAFALATMLTLRYPKPAVYIPAFIWAGMVGYGRVYNGVHYPSDVLGGAVVGAGSSILTFALRGTVIDVFDRVTGRKSGSDTSFLIMPVEGGAEAHVQMRF
jgi:membrane-associated phospholipid phosphatase